MSASSITNSPAPITRAIEKFPAFDRVSGALVILDDRTFDAQSYTTDGAADAFAKLSAQEQAALFGTA